MPASKPWLRKTAHKRQQAPANLSVESLEGRLLLSAESPLAPPLLPGDYNGDNQVDDDDHVVWVAGYGQSGVGLAADGNLDGVVDAADYTVWRDHYGEVFVNTPPMAVGDAVSVSHGETSLLIPSQLLDNDSDPDGEPLVITGVSNAVGGVVELVNGLVFFTPHGMHGGAHEPMDMSFEYTIADGSGAESSATVSVSVLPPIHGAGDEQRAAEHAALFSILDARDATAIAVRDGAWSDPDTWYNCQVPTAGDRVLIHRTVEVEYDVLSDAPLEWLRVNGVLRFAHDTPTRVLVETIAVDPFAVLHIGSTDQAIDAKVTAEVLIDTTGGAISQLDDPTLISRGFISHGQTNIYGAEKAEYTTLGVDASGGDSWIELTDATAPLGWRVGDVLLLAGTDANPALLGPNADGAAIAAADADNARFRDELLEITGMQVIGGRVRVSFNNVTNDASIAEGRTTLLWNHERPDGETFDPDELSIHVANLTRNVVVRSSDPTVDTQERGHFMVMHNRNANIHHAQFRDLGRTDKLRVIDDPAVIGNFDGSPGTGTNPRGRYGLHVHRLGANSLAGPAAMVTGNVVWGTPGWGIVHHDSHAVLEDNVVFDVVGAGIVAEDGNELGEWRGNLVVKTTGDLQNNFDDGAIFATLRGPRFDLGFVGSGYWVQGGGFGILLEDNIAASTNAAGFDLVHNIDALANVEQIPVSLIADPVVRQAMIDAGFEYVTPNNIPTRGVDGLTVYNGFRGVHTWLHNRDSGDMEGTFSFPTFLAHEFRSTIENYTLWGVRSGVQNFYSTRIDFLNGLVVGDPDNLIPYFVGRDQGANDSFGAGITHNHEEANKDTFDGLRLEGFTYGFQVFTPFNEERVEVTPYATSELLNAEFANLEHAFTPTSRNNPLSATDYFADLFIIDEASTFNTLGSATNTAPTAAFSYTTGEGVTALLDAGSSFDPDPSPTVRAGDDGIVAYAWDLDNDGLYGDAYGETLTLPLSAAGEYSIGLKVWDDDGATSTTTQIVTVESVAYNNPWVDADFSDTAPYDFESYLFWSGKRGNGWVARNVARNAAGFLEIDTPQYGLGEFGQIIRDEQVRRGVQTFSFDLRNSATAGFPESLRVRVMGVDGQWALDDLGGSIGAVSAMPEPSVATLLDTQLGPQSIPNWQTQSFQIDLGATGYEYLVVYVDYQGYEYAQGDYFSFDNFSLTGPAPAFATAGLSSLVTAQIAQSDHFRLASTHARRPQDPGVTHHRQQALLLWEQATSILDDPNEIELAELPDEITFESSQATRDAVFETL